MKNLSGLSLGMVAAWVLVACGDGGHGDGGYGDGGYEIPDDRFLAQGGEEVCYRGERVWASRSDGDLLIEGDIIVGPSDRWCDDELPAGGSEPGISRESLKRQGAEGQWPDGVVPYEFESGFPAEDLSLVLAAMNDWELLVPGLDFVPRTTQPDSIRFVKNGSNCSSSVGRQTGVQSIKLPDGCLEENFTVHHEIAHALGVYHQHTRKDRDAFVRINWGNILGCPSSATQASDCGSSNCSSNLADCGCTVEWDEDGSCYLYTNFKNASNRSDIGVYDYDSVMHYGFSWFRKPGTDHTIDVLHDDSDGNPFLIGQRDHLSTGDVFAMQAMYPTLAIERSIFSGNGSQRLCALSGRTEDIAVVYTVTGVPGVSGNSVDRSFVLPGTYPMSCTAKSSFWDDNYDYPNAQVAFNSSLIAETHTREAPLCVLSPGIIPALL